MSFTCLFARAGGELRADFRSEGIFDLLEDGKCLFGVWDGLSMLAELVQRQTQIPQIVAFASAVANLAMNEQCLFIKLDGGVRSFGPDGSEWASNGARTIRSDARLGWFSVQYPALFRLEAMDSHLFFLKSIIQRNRDYVNEREQYGLLRYMNRACASELASVEDWSQGVAFNFPGDLDPKSHPDDPFWLYQDGLHALLEFTRERQDHDRGFRFFVVEGRLHMQVLFRKGAFADKEMDELLQSTEDAFLQFISQLSHAPEAGQREERILVEELKPNSRGVSA